MEWASADVIGVINYLLPGFLAAWVFYGLTAHQKSDAFERVVQALIFTVLVKSLVYIPRGVWWQCARHVEGKYWTEGQELGWSIVIATLLGLVFAFCANRDFPHSLLVKWNITKRTSFPSEWNRAFNRQKRYVVLHLKGKDGKGKRVRGWPEEFPDHPDRGHFILSGIYWLSRTAGPIPVPQTKYLMIPVTDVTMIEMLSERPELKWNDQQMAAAQKPLVELHKQALAQEKAASESNTD